MIVSFNTTTNEIYPKRSIFYNLFKKIEENIELTKNNDNFRNSLISREYDTTSEELKIQYVGKNEILFKFRIFEMIEDDGTNKCRIIIKKNPEYIKSDVKYLFNFISEKLDIYKHNVEFQTIKSYEFNRDNIDDIIKKLEGFEEYLEITTQTDKYNL
jgi:hypothetical protein